MSEPKASLEAEQRADGRALPSPAHMTREELQRRVHALVQAHMDFVWRSLRRLGVDDADCDDGCQRVWVVVARKVLAIEPAKEKSFIFSVVVRVASEMRRSQRRHQHVRLRENAFGSATPDAEHLLERQSDLAALDELLDGLSWELRTVFIMFELEGMTSVEIAGVLGVSRGTVASRLRLARDAFQRGVRRQLARQSGPLGSGPSPTIFARGGSHE
jgi:RNA polymerase sigma-70 factor, ECF subfamily